MACLHSHHFIHRDLKPLNILISDRWLAKIADFGEAKKLPQSDDDGKERGSLSRHAVSASASTPTSAPATEPAHEDAASEGVMTARVHGTAPYIAPEAAAAGMHNAPRVGMPSDVWSFGCMLAHMAARRPPYIDVCAGKEAQRLAIAHLRDGSAKPLSMLKPGENMPEHLMSIAADCTRWASNERPTFDDLVKERFVDPGMLHELYGGGRASAYDDEMTGVDRIDARRPPVKCIRLERKKSPRVPATLTTHVV